jgi:anaerobic dimethyl sulfoxide reductase subunit A
MKKFFKKIRAGGNDSSGPYSAPSDDGSGAETGTRLFWNSCNVNCGGLCLLRTHVRDGKIVRIETDNLGDDAYGNHQVRACLRGRSMRKRVYAPERLKYPMKRVGRRGEGNFRRISWDEAFDLIAGKMKHVKEKYGNEAFYITYATGSIDAVMSKSWPPSPIARLMNCYGGYLNYDNTYSYSQISTALTYTYGRGWVSGNSLSDIINSRLVVFFGNNPAETRMSGGGMVHDLLVAKKKGNAKVVMVDPRYNDTAVAVADEWVPIRPGTDAAFVGGLAHVLITENLVDEDFLANYCVGYDEEHMPEGIPPGNSYKSYILGLGRDKTPKTPEWASRITGIPPDVIIRLGREIGQAKPAYISQGWGAQRHSNGEQTARAISMLSILTGNAGIHGGNTGARENNHVIPFARFPTLENPVKTAIPVFLWTDAVMRGPEMTAKKDGVRGADRVRAHTKFIWNFAGNALINQHSDVNRTRKILEDDSRCEMIVVIEHFMTQSAMFADILLPSVTNLEENDFATTTSLSSSEMAYVVFNRKAIEPMFECRSVYDMCAEIAKRLDLWDRYTEGRTRDQWLQHILDWVCTKNGTGTVL